MIHDLPLEVLPIVQARAPQIVVVNTKPQRTDQPQLGAQCDAGPPHAPGVVGNLRFVQDNMQLWFVTHTVGITEGFVEVNRIKRVSERVPPQRVAGFVKIQAPRATS